MNRYNINGQVRVEGVFKNLSGVEVDPTSVILKVRNSEGLTTYAYPEAVEKNGTGNYYVDLTLTVEGKWDYQWVGSGDVIAAADGCFIVSQSMS